MSSPVPVPGSGPTVVAVPVPGQTPSTPQAVPVSPVVVTQDTYEVTFGGTGEIRLETGKSRWYAGTGGMLRTVRASVATPAAGSDIVIVVNKNASPWVTLAIPAGAFMAASNVHLPIQSGDYLTVDITQIGSDTPGDFLTLSLNLSRSS